MPNYFSKKVFRRFNDGAHSYTIFKHYDGRYSLVIDGETHGKYRYLSATDARQDAVAILREMRKISKQCVAVVEAINHERRRFESMPRRLWFSRLAKLRNPNKLNALIKFFENRDMPTLRTRVIDHCFSIGYNPFV